METIVSGWQADQHAAFHPDFLSEAEAVEFKEVEPSWHDVEDFAATFAPEAEEQETAEPSEEEPETEERKAERGYLVRQRLYADLDSQLATVANDGNAFTVTPTMSKPTRAFCLVVGAFLAMRNGSTASISRYSDEGKGTKNWNAPTRVDFVADVEITAKRALKLQPALLNLFVDHILELDGEQWDKVPMLKRSKISDLVGNAFMAAKIHPAGGYFHGKAK